MLQALKMDEYNLGMAGQRPSVCCNACATHVQATFKQMRQQVRRILEGP